VSASSEGEITRIGQMLPSAGFERIVKGIDFPYPVNMTASGARFQFFRRPLFVERPRQIPIRARSFGKPLPPQPDHGRAYRVQELSVMRFNARRTEALTRSFIKWPASCQTLRNGDAARQSHLRRTLTKTVFLAALATVVGRPADGRRLLPP